MYQQNMPTQFIAFDPTTGAQSPFLTTAVPPGYALSAFAFHQTYLYMSLNQAGAISSTVQRLDLAKNITATAAVPFSCTYFAFDDALFDSDTAMCVGRNAGLFMTLYAFNVVSRSSKQIGAFPYTDVDNADHAYDPKAHVYYLRLDDTMMTRHMVGLSAVTGKVVSNPLLSLSLTFAGPMAIDPLAGIAYATVVGQPSGPSYLASIVPINGTATPFPTAFYGPWTQGAFDAVISEYDRCNTLFSMLLYVSGNSPVISIVGNDMSSGAMVMDVTIPFQAVNSVGYYNGPVFAGAA